jgi:leader peptidase (prepilin peptidase)/N-methyltransferase
MSWVGATTTVLFAGAVGGVGGSFASTLALRALQGRSALRGRSRCDSCGLALGFAATVPVVSFIAHRGRCAACGAAISPAHLAGELAGVLAAASMVLLSPPVLWPWGLLLLVTLIFAAIYDAASMRIPDLASLAVGVLGLVAAALQERLIEAALTGAATALALLLLRAVFAKVTGRPGLGLGDVKLVSGLAVWAGPTLTPAGLLLASLIGLGWLAARRELQSSRRLPFAPSIAAGFWLVVLARSAL